MADEDDNLIYLAVGAIAPILLGMALIPLRDFTTASNFTFPFMALTIAAAEFGGRRAAVATALSSALSLDFFLTQPYLRLTIEGKHDIIAFVGLMACGLLAAAFGSRRRRRVAAPEHLDLLHGVLRLMDRTGPIGPALDDDLDAARSVLPLSAAVVRNARGEIVGASRGGRALAAPSRVLVSLDALWSPEIPLPRRGLPIPDDGVRLPLAAGNAEVGWLDLWGNGARADVESRRTLSDMVGALSALFVSASRGSVLEE